MLKSERDYEKAIRKMLLRVQNVTSLEEIQPHQMSLEDAEILMDCIKQGYLVGKTEDNGIELRTLDGKAHPELLSSLITPKGFAFLKPKNTDMKATAAIVISSFALLISILSSLDKILENIRWLIDLL